jgi:glycolate oxidase FAD binding subunit
MTDAAAAIERLRAEVAASPVGTRLLPVAGATKPALSLSARADVQALDVSGLSGIVEYDPAELTVTALAATPVAEVAQALAQHGQYLPFDPPLAAAGATLGGTLCAAASGSGALRHGGIRDFVIGVRLIDGTGHVVGGGGRVVKNAAGFDLPKLMVGSRGRLGVVVQVSLKVFPRPRATLTLEFACPDAAAAVATARGLVAGPRELDAADVVDATRLLVRIGGEVQALPERAARAIEAAGHDAVTHDGPAEARLWEDAAALAWVPGGARLLRVPLTAREAPALVDVVAAAGGATRLVRAANLAWVAWPAAQSLAGLHEHLSAAGLVAVPFWGPPDTGLLGAHQPSCAGGFAARVRAALDPHDRFLEL